MVIAEIRAATPDDADGLAQLRAGAGALPTRRTRDCAPLLMPARACSERARRFYERYGVHADGGRKGTRYGETDVVEVRDRMDNG
jgi:hypothetical protein